MALKEENWITFEDDEEALSLSDLPVIDQDDCCCRDQGTTKSPESEDFEFRTFGGGLLLKAAETDMCAADDVFFQGQILPLRPSVSSVDSGFHPISRGGSRSDSMDDRYSSVTAGSLGFESSSSSRSLSGSISRSHSTNSYSSASNEAPGRHSISNNFYAHPSPKPHVCARRKSTAVARKSTSSPGAGWGLFRLGLVKTPAIELTHRKAGVGHTGNVTGGKVNNDETRSEWRTQRHSSETTGRSKESRNDAKPEKKATRFIGSRLRCKCSPDDAVDPVSSRIVIITRTKKEEGSISSSNPREEVMCRNRTFEWLAELSVPKAPVA